MTRIYPRARVTRVSPIRWAVTIHETPDRVSLITSLATRDRALNTAAALIERRRYHTGLQRLHHDLQEPTC